jgi:prolyl-tRNA synthetase
MELNETKLANAVGARDLRPATEAEIEAVGAVPGFASPIGLSRINPRQAPGTSCKVILDDSIPSSPNLVAGANEADFHLLNTNYPRDYAADLVTDMASAEADYSCPQCGHPLKAVRGVEVGNIFQLGTRYSDSLGCTYLDRDGQPKPVVMGSYGIGIGRLLACVAEEHHDDYGLIWPVTVAPYQVHLVLLRGKNAPRVEETALRLYAELQASGIEVLYDDREESPGVKFNDADLIGLPLRLTVSERALAQNSVESKLRSASEKTMVPLEETLQKVREIMQSLLAGISAQVLPVEYNA